MRKLDWLSLIVLAAAIAQPATAALVPPKPPTPQEQLKALTDKAEGGDAQAQYDLAQVYFDALLDQKADEKTALSWITRSAEAGNASAQYDLAVAYRLGHGVKPDAAQSLTWYVQAADQGRDEARAFVCEAYTQSDTVTPDWPKSLPYCQTAAEKGDANAQYAVGMAYLEGRGVTPDNALALASLKKAADQGHAGALTELGQIYMIGDLAPQDQTEAVNLFKKAAKRGDRQAVRLLAHQYETGAGTPVDIGRAARLYRILARDDTDSAAKDWLKAHPDAPDDTVLELNKIPRDIMFFATETNDPRFQTMDIHGYYDQLSVSAYPVDAQNDKVGGRASAECRFTASGDLDDCVLTEEDPKGYGFGASLMRIMDRLGTSGNKTDWAKSYDGKSLRLSMRWKPD
ncbi:tetratricopeptide repeat protein [Asticcacaulis taihuensis]|uniref:tetratricopeptide repeat protein n=1 Tax=Asticcacaulis taihuensis TaxID=260084 RepID=UPI0026EF3FCC|nr:tetratricopeptide repeat protein [Asticcacaulis taihuensis]